MEQTSRSENAIVRTYCFLSIHHTHSWRNKSIWLVQVNNKRKWVFLTLISSEHRGPWFKPNISLSTMRTASLRAQVDVVRPASSNIRNSMRSFDVKQLREWKKTDIGLWHCRMTCKEPWNLKIGQGQHSSKKSQASLFLTSRMRIDTRVSFSPSTYGFKHYREQSDTDLFTLWQHYLELFHCSEHPQRARK